MAAVAGCFKFYNFGKAAAGGLVGQQAINLLQLRQVAAVKILIKIMVAVHRHIGHIKFVFACNAVNILPNLRPVGAKAKQHNHGAKLRFGGFVIRNRQPVELFVSHKLAAGKNAGRRSAVLLQPLKNHICPVANAIKHNRLWVFL